MDSEPVTFHIGRLPRGGYVVESRRADNLAGLPLFASADIDDALGFIKDQFEPGPKITAAGELKDARPDGIIPAKLVRGGFLANALRAREAGFEEKADQLNAANAVQGMVRCPHCGIPEAHRIDDRCTGACTRFELNKHGDVFK